MDSKKVFKRLLNENRTIITVLTILSCLYSAFLVVFALFTKLLIDNINHEAFITHVIVLSALIVIEVFLKVLINLIHLKSVLKLENKLKKETLGDYLKNDYFTIDNKLEIDWLNRINNDTKIVANGIITFIPNFISLIVRIVVAIAVLSYIDWKFALALLGISLIGFILSKFLRQKSKSLHKKAQEEEGNSLNFYKNAINHFSLIKLFNAEKRIGDSCDLIQEKYYIAKKRVREFSVFINTAFLLVMRLSYLGAIIYSAILIANGDTSVSYGSLLAMIQLINHIEIPFTSLSGLLPTYYHCLGSIERIEEYVPLKVNDCIKNVTFDSPIIVNDISFSYDNKILFKNLSFLIEKGDFVLIKGYSGKGKTTLLKLIMGMYKPSAGYIKIGDEDISNIKGLFSYVPQNNYLVNGSIKENIMLFANRSVSEEEINKVLKTVNMEEKINSLQDKLDTRLKDDGAGLSIGEAQRINIARALLANKEILILDECTSALDSLSADVLLENLSKLDKTIIMVSHKGQSIRFANKIIDINDYGRE